MPSSLSSETRRASPNRRILIVDDNPAIYQDFRKILLGSRTPSAKLEQLEASLFGSGDAPASGAVSDFAIDGALQGQEALARVKTMLQKEQPYALAFIDMRMPPGWDGVETVEHLWSVQPDLKVVFCSAYSDYSWHEVISRLRRPGLRLLQKPFKTSEVLNLAWELTNAWNARGKK